MPLNAFNNGVNQFGWYNVDHFRNLNNGYYIGNNFAKKEFP